MKNQKEKEAYEAGVNEAKIKCIIENNFAYINNYKVVCNICGKEMYHNNIGWMIKHSVKHQIYG